MNSRFYSLLILSTFLLLVTVGTNDLFAKGKKMKKSEMITALSNAEKEIESLKKELNNLKSENDRLGEELDNADLKLAEQEVRTQKALAQAGPFLSDRMPTEVYFKVQLGAYKELDLREYFSKSKTLGTEEVDAGVKKYVVGEFDLFESAKKFQADLRKLGIKDAWLVPYKNNNRISDEEASESVGQDIRK